jgi:hypothetical protein
MADMKPGERLRCADCGTQIIVIKPDGSVPQCCGKDMESAAVKS